MKKTVAIITALLLFPGFSHGATIAVCGEESGRSYFPYAGATDSSDAGWHDNGVSGGVTTLTYTTDGQYDLLFYDATKAIRSTVGEGGFVRDLYIGEKIASFLVVSSDASVDVYNFIETNAGTYEMTRTANRMNEGAVPNFSVFKSQCTEINFEVFGQINAENENLADIARDAAKDAYKAAQEAARLAE